MFLTIGQLTSLCEMSSALDVELAPAQWRTFANMPYTCIESKTLDQDEQDRDEQVQPLFAMDCCPCQLIDQQFVRRSADNCHMR